jgi:hypothetical protein
VKVLAVEELYIVDVGHLGIGKPGILGEGEQVFALADQQPEAVRGDVADLNRSVFPRGFDFLFPRR